MARKIKITDHSFLTLRYRAVCSDDNFRSSWTEDINTALQAAREHRAVQGNEDHIIKIVTEQTFSMVFNENM